MENENKPKLRVKHPDRVSISPEALTRLGEWITELELNAKGIRITKNDLVSFLILSHSAHLSEKEVSQIKGQHFDEVRFAEWALKQLKSAKADGKSLSLSDILELEKNCQNAPKSKDKNQPS